MLIKKKDFFKNLEQRLKALQKANTEIGYWQEQGMHTSYEGGSEISYPKLAYIHNHGINTPARPYFAIGMFSKPISTNKTLKKDLKRYFNDIKSAQPKLSASGVMSNVAGDYIQTFRSIIGSSQLKALSQNTIDFKSTMGASKPSAPLHFSGDLRDKISFKIDNGSLQTPA